MIAIIEDGYEEVELAGAVVQIDLYEAHNTMIRLGVENPDPVKFHAAVAAWAASKGYPAFSNRVADQFMVAVARRIEELKKKDPA